MMDRKIHEAFLELLALPAAESGPSPPYDGSQHFVRGMPVAEMNSETPAGTKPEQHRAIGMDDDGTIPREAEAPEPSGELLMRCGRTRRTRLRNGRSGSVGFSRYHLRERECIPDPEERELIGHRRARANRASSPERKVPASRSQHMCRTEIDVSSAVTRLNADGRLPRVRLVWVLAVLTTVFPSICPAPSW